MPVDVSRGATRVPTPAEHEASRPPCRFEHLECSSCGGNGKGAAGICGDCRGYGERLCEACERFVDAFLAIQDSFPTREARQEWNLEWLGLGLPPKVQRAIRSLPAILRREAPHAR